MTVSPWSHTDPNSTEEIESDTEMDATPIEPAVLSLSPHGVVDIDGVDVTDSELMAHALANCAQLI